MASIREFIHDVKYLFEESPPPYTPHDLTEKVSRLVSHLEGSPYEHEAKEVLMDVERLLFEQSQYKALIADLKKMLD